MKAIIAVPATLLLVYRAWSRNSLTPSGIVVAALTATVHALHPWNLPFALLCVFFLAGTRATHVKKEVKATLTLSSSGSAGEGPRTHVQVLANSAMASVFTLLHAWQLRQRSDPQAAANGTLCYSWRGDLLVLGIVANYAAVCADTFSSELGILSRGDPRLITSLTLRRVPRGTNGGVTAWGLLMGLLGSMVIVSASLLFLPFCPESWTASQKATLAWGLLVWGALGSLLDSFLGGWLQRSVTDVRSGKSVEGEGGARVLVSRGGGGGGGGAQREAQDKGKDGKPTRRVESGLNLLDNNDVNFLMAFIMSVGAVAGGGWYWGIPLDSIFKA